MFEDIRFIYQNHDGAVHLVVPSPFFNGPKEQLIKQSIPEGVAYFEVDKNDIPSDLSKMEAWEIKDGRIHVNESKLQLIEKDL